MRRFVLAAACAFILSSASPGIAWSAEKAPPAVQAEFTDFFARFKAALKADDAAAVAGMAKLPFQNDPTVSNAAQFRDSIYKESFTKTYRACLGRGKAIYFRDQEGTDSYEILCGELIYVFTRTPDGFRLTDLSVND